MACDIRAIVDLWERLGHNLVEVPTYGGGEYQFFETTHYFADNDLGTGAITEMDIYPEGLGKQGWRQLVRLKWVDWNQVSFEILDILSQYAERIEG